MVEVFKRHEPFLCNLHVPVKLAEGTNTSSASNNCSSGITWEVHCGLGDWALPPVATPSLFLGCMSPLLGNCRSLKCCCWVLSTRATQLDMDMF